MKIQIRLLQIRLIEIRLIEIRIAIGDDNHADEDDDVQGEMWSSGLPLLALNLLPADENSAIIGH